MGHYYYCDGVEYYGSGYCNSRWNDWGRWVLAAGLIVIAIIIFLSLACMRNRRRRRMMQAPINGPGWVGGNPNVPYNNPNAPPYQAPGFQQTGNTYGNDGYYAPYGQGPQPGVELQPPQNVYARDGAAAEYGPPAGPPPGKGDGVIR